LTKNITTIIAIYYYLLLLFPPKSMKKTAQLIKKEGKIYPISKKNQSVFSPLKNDPKKERKSK